MREDRQPGAREPKPVDQAGVVEGIAEDVVVRVNQGREDTDVELKSAGEEDGVFGAKQVGEGALGGAVLGEVASDKTRGGGSRGLVQGKSAKLRVVGKTKIVVAAKTSDPPPSELVTDALATTNAGELAGEAVVVQGVKTATQSLVQVLGHA